MSDRWDDGGDDYDVWWWGVDRCFYGEVDDGDDDGNKFLGAPDTSDRWVRRIRGTEMGSHLKDTRPLNHMYHLLYQMQHLQPVIRRLRVALKKCSIGLGAWFPFDLYTHWNSTRISQVWRILNKPDTILFGWTFLIKHNWQKIPRWWGGWDLKREGLLCQYAN